MHTHTILWFPLTFGPDSNDPYTNSSVLAEEDSPKIKGMAWLESTFFEEPPAFLKLYRNMVRNTHKERMFFLFHQQFQEANAAKTPIRKETVLYFDLI